MSAPKLETWAALALGLGALYLISKAASAASSAATAVKGTVTQAASTANDATAGVVGGIGSVVGLPTPGQTIDDPAVVRWIIDNQGYMEGSKWGTAMAFLRALAMPAGSGHPPAAVKAPTPASTPSQASNGDILGSWGTDSPGSFNAIKSSDPTDPTTWGYF